MATGVIKGVAAILVVMASNCVGSRPGPGDGAARGASRVAALSKGRDFSSGLAFRRGRMTEGVQRLRGGGLLVVGTPREPHPCPSPFMFLLICSVFPTCGGPPLQPGSPPWIPICLPIVRNRAGMRLGVARTARSEEDASGPCL